MSFRFSWQFVIILSMICYAIYYENCWKFPVWRKYLVIDSLSKQIIGQDVAVHAVVESMTNYIDNFKLNREELPLVMSFHGGVGVGKTYLASLLYKYLPNNTHVSVFSYSHHYLKSLDNNNNKNKVQSWIERELSICNWNVFILDDFDNIGSAQQTLTDALTYVKNSVLLRRMYLILVVISRINSDNINGIVFKKYAESSSDNQLKLVDFSPVFEEDGLNGWLFKLHKKGLINAVVPFSPLTKNNVLECIKFQLHHHHSKLINKEDISMKVLNNIFNSSDSTNHDFSETGCKKVSDEINALDI
ncbi:torsin-1A-like [Argonauta hians]